MYPQNPSAQKPTSERVSQGAQDVWRHGSVKVPTVFQKAWKAMFQGCWAIGCGECRTPAQASPPAL